MTKRKRIWCDWCEQDVPVDAIHSCYDAKAVREAQARERERDDKTTTKPTTEGEG